MRRGTWRYIGAIAAVVAVAAGAAPAARAEAPAGGVVVIAALETDAVLPAAAPDGVDRALVLRVQQRLRELGLYEGPLDGRMGPATAAAIRAYQRWSALDVDGAASRALLEHLESAASEARRLLHRLDEARREQISAAWRALEEHAPARALVSGASNQARLERARATVPEACFAAPTSACLLDVALVAAVAVHKLEFRDWALADVAVAEAAGGDGAGALATAARVSDPRMVIATLRRIARAQAEAGDVVGARATARAIPDAATRAEAINAIAAAQLVAGDTGAAQETLAQALLATGAVTDAGRQSLLLSEIAGVQVKLGDRAGATASLDRALERARAIDTPDERERALSRIAVIQADAGRPAVALATTETITEPGQRTPALIRAAAAQAAAGEISRALATAAAIEDARYRTAALQEVALVQARRGATAAARKTLARARAVSEEIDYGFAQAEAGDVVGARATARAIPDAATRAEAINAIAAAQLVAGDTGAAQETLAQALLATGAVTDAGRQSLLLSEIAGVQVKLGDRAGATASLDRALERARAIDTPDERERALSRIAVIQADAGRPAVALATTETITEPGQRTPALIRAAAAQAAAGEISRALATAAAIEDARYRTAALQEVALVQARRGATAAARKTLARARAVSEEIDYGFAHAYALSRVARAQADIGAIGDALETAGLIDGGPLRARALWAVSLSQVRLGDAVAARRSGALADAAMEEIADALDRVWLFGDIAVKRLHAGDAAGARATFGRGLDYAGALTTPWLRARALAKLATALAEIERAR